MVTRRIPSDEQQRYNAVITALDAGVGKILRQLDDLNSTQNTLVAFVSDNGAFMIPTRGLGVVSNKPFRVGGSTVWEGGIRVQAIFRWPGVLPEGVTNSEMLVNMDLLPMALKVAGIALPEDRVFNGFDITACLKGESSSPHEYLYLEWGSNSAAIRKGPLKLLKESNSTNREWQLFNLETDLGETANLVSQFPDMALALKTEWQRWKLAMQ